jgi:hypothetical protein
MWTHCAPPTVCPRPRVQFAVINAVSIGFLNLSLAFNSVGFYQMTKLAIIPGTVTLQTLFYGKSFSTRVKLTLVVLLLVRRPHHSSIQP